MLQLLNFLLKLREVLQDDTFISWEFSFAFYLVGLFNNFDSGGIWRFLWSEPSLVPTCKCLRLQKHAGYVENFLPDVNIDKSN